MRIPPPCWVRAGESDRLFWQTGLYYFDEDFDLLNRDFLKGFGLLTDKPLLVAVNTTEAEAFRERYRQRLKAAQTECPPPDESQRKKGQRGRLKRSKSRNLLERLIQYEEDVLRFMVELDVPFTNNQGERDLRMSKVQQKISGCFRSELGAKIFSRIRSYLSTCQKHGVSSEEALRLLYEGRWPEFIGIAPE